MSCAYKDRLKQTRAAALRDILGKDRFELFNLICDQVRGLLVDGLYRVLGHQDNSGIGLPNT